MAAKRTYVHPMLEAAYYDVQKKGFPIRQAARMHSVPESTLRSRLNNPKGMDAKRGGQTIFSRHQEEQLAGHCVAMAYLGYGFTRWQLLDMAKGMAEACGKDVEPTKHWFYGFLSRFPELKMVQPKKREKARDDSVSEEVLECYFKELSSILEKYDIKNKPGQIWNVDESGISLDHTPPKVLARAGTNPHSVTSGRSGNTTIIAAGSALGETIPPYLIYKGERLTKEMQANGLPGSEYRVSPTGWSNSALFLDFFQNHFLHHVSARPCLLLYDGHSTHVTVDVIEAARANDVHLFVLPPHSSHCLQPLDVSVFSAFKKSLNSEFHKYMHANPNNVITKELLPSIVGKAYKSAMAVQNIMSGFRKTGIFPFSPSAVTVEPPTITKQPLKSNTTRKERKDNRKVTILFKEKAEEFDRLKEPLVKKKKRKAFVPPYGAAVTEETYYAEKKRKQTIRPPLVLDKDIPQIRRTTQSTFTPPFLDQPSDVDGQHSSASRQVYSDGKDQQQGKKKTGKGPHPNSKRGKTPVARKRSRPVTENLDASLNVNNNDDDDDEVCIVCGKFQPDGFHLNDRLRFVEWGQCCFCSKWVHLSFCTAVEHLTDEDTFRCPNCAEEE